MEVPATATLEKRETGLGTSSRFVVRLIPRRAGSISSFYGAKTGLKAQKKKIIIIIKLCMQPHKKNKNGRTVLSDVHKFKYWYGI